MNPTNNNISKLTDAFSKGTTGLIFVPVNASYDATSAALALAAGLTKLGKSASVVSSTPVKHDIPHVDSIGHELSSGGDNLVISFPYTEGSIEKVDYGVQGTYFNIIITPHAGQPKLEANKVKFSYTGGKFDFIVTIDAPNINALGPLYTENQNEFQGKTIINIDRHLVNDLYGTVNVVNKTSSSTSELILKILHALQAEIDKEMATTLYAGIASATNNFSSYSVNADTFEAAAVLLKMGALKKAPVRPQAPQQPMTPQAAPAVQQHQMPQPPRRAPMPQAPAPRPQVQTQPQPAHIQPMPPEEAPRPIEEVEQNPNPPEQATPQDWLKPKIFRGGGLV